LIAFWIFAILTGLSVFAWFSFTMGVVPAFFIAAATVLVMRGLASWIKRYLVLTERIADEKVVENRTLEINRYIFWRRASFLIALLALYLGGMGILFHTSPLDALVVLPGLLVSALAPLVQIVFLMLANFTIFFGPFLLFGKMGRQTIQPGDANYDVKIEDVRGQKSAVNEMKRILRLIEQGRNYVKAGGKRERGVLMVGPPGTGKTMLAKGIASSLQMPIIITSGASFQGMFLGMDLVAVFMMCRAARKKAKRWGGCAIFIDEFDALGNRRSGMGGAGGGMGGMFGGGQLGLNMLLVQMDGVDNPTFMKRFLRRGINLTLDGLFVPRQLAFNGTRLSMRVPQLKAPRYNLFFVGATNRPSVLDEAVTRPGRFGRQIIFRMPTREDRKDIADLYFSRKKHDPNLDTPERRDEFARVTEGYSPAMIEQALSIALMYAFEDGRDAFNWKDMREAMGNIEAGLVEPVVYTERELVAVARHELGHAVAAKYFLPEEVSVRLSVKMRGGSLGHHRTSEKEEEFSKFRSQLAGDIRHGLGAIASERVFYGENSTGVSMDLIQSTRTACTMVGVYAMGPDPLPKDESRRAANFGEYLFSLAETTRGLLDQGPPSVTAAVLGNRLSRRAAAQVMGAAYIDDWRLMNVNKEAIDQAALALMAQGELVGDEIGGLLDSVNLRMFNESDPYPPEIDFVPSMRDEDEARREPEEERREATA